MFKNDYYADADATFGENLESLFFDRCKIFASLPSHSATSLGAVLLYVQCVCFSAGFGLFMFGSDFVLKAFCNFGRIRDVTSAVIPPD